ncbi:MAG TPA: DUF89 family protein [Candidatus Omnitrophica bacterium]|nr:DUF89 family protein [Candidatus Omnitrophota bacterium]
MKTSVKCISCFFKQIETASFLAGLDEKKKKYIFSLLTKKLLKFDFNNPPVVFGRTIYKTVSRISKVKDIFAKEKIKIENFLKRKISFLEKKLEKEKNSLYLGAKLSCLGNSVDFGAGEYPDLKKIFLEMERVKFKVNHFKLFKKKLKEAKKILFVADNCGEVFFDRLFIKEILKYHPNLKIFYAARSSPIINDVLVEDAKRAEMDKLTTVFSSGCGYPGLILSKTSVYFKKIWKKVDFVISKGQGNFESLKSKKDIFYIFKIKCPTVSDFLSLPQDSLLFLYNKYMV